MTPSRTSIVVIACLLLIAPSVSAAWHDDYDAGLAAAKRGDWPTVITRMNAALRQKSSEGRERTYGNIFIEYRPYYYRGVAHFERGDFAAAKADFLRTKGPGAQNFGTTDSFLLKIAAATASTPTPTPTPPPPPTPTVTVTPRVIDTPQRPTPPTPTPTPPIIIDTPRTPTPTSEPTSVRIAREAAEKLLVRADAAEKAAKERARSPQARQQLALGTKELQLARSLQRSAQRSAKSAADWTRVGDAAEGARLQFEVIPAGDPMEEMRRRVRGALDSYFSGRFTEASTQLINLTRENPSNGFLWAFLGASRYSEYYIDGERNAALRQASENAFRQARLNGMTELSPAYFSPRIRRFFVSVR
ncbi:MAG TPA: hypothetical protein VMS12_11905 [Thermoanaerobaculia bacterium]|nr:hypothetical protein [Thermoanaerobaculia bacterium]